MLRHNKAMDPIERAKALFFQSIEHLENEHWPQAEACLKEALQYAPERPSLLNNLSVALLRLGKYDEAEQVIAKVLLLEPDAPEGWVNRGELCNLRGQHEMAIENFDRALALDAGHVEAHVNRGVALGDLKRHDMALQCFDRAIELNSEHAAAWANKGNTLIALGNPQSAVDAYSRAIQLRPKLAVNFVNRANALILLGQHRSAVDDAVRAIALNPGYAEAHFCSGNAKLALGQFSPALESFVTAASLKPDYAEAWFNQGHALERMKRFREAIVAYECVTRLKSDYEYLPGVLLHARMQIGDWKNFQSDVDHIKSAIEHRRAVSNSFSALSFFDEPALHRIASEIWVRHKCPADASLGAIARRPRKKKIRVAYYSPDFRDHAVGHLAAGLYEHHDRSRFELIAFAFGPNNNDGMRQRIAASFEEFIDADALDDRSVARLSREKEIDIAVDLGGYTEHCRPGVFARRAAPIQVNYLGYPGTMGASYMDYLLADSIVIAQEWRKHYSEKIVYLPHSYQANDNKRPEIKHIHTRADWRLPASGFVFCCFNNNFKITPDTFDSWMRILKAVDGSVLWLLKDNSDIVDNLRREAMHRGVAGERLVFAERTSRAEHLARHLVADLFIDTLPYNAHTTASDALWVGLPLLTCTGKSFAGRVATSLLKAIDLPELITTTPAEFEKRAIALASDPGQLTEIKQRLIRNRRTTPLFNTALFTRHIEAAYDAMMERYYEGLPPDDISVTG